MATAQLAHFEYSQLQQFYPQFLENFKNGPGKTKGISLQN